MLKDVPGLGIGTGIGRFLAKSEKTGNPIFAAGFPAKDFLWQMV